MPNKQIQYIAKSFAWGVVAKLIDAATKFMTIPILLNYFGKENYGLLTLALATNAYMNLLDMGMNTGSVKYFSQWIALGKYELINRVSRTSLTFYLIIGCINALILILLAFTAHFIFNISPTQIETFRYLLIILSTIGVINWTTFVFNQLLIADEKIAFVQQMLSVRSVLSIGVILLTVYFSYSLIEYFFLYLLVNSFVIVPFYITCRKRNLIQSLSPAFYWKDFSVIIKYSLAIFAMSLFQFTATQSRPLVLGMFSSDGVNILSEYRILEVFPLFIISLGGMLTSIFLPKTSKYIQDNDREAIEHLVYRGTLYTSILISFLCFPIILVAKDLLILYVGSEYQDLYIWLSLWIFTLTIFLHNSPVASLVLATGKTKMLVYSSAISCIVSMVINAIFCPFYGVGSAVIGYLVYIIIQISFYYFYFDNKILGLNSYKIFKSYIIPMLCGLLTLACVYMIPITTNLLWLNIIVKCLMWIITYGIVLFLFRVITKKDLEYFSKNLGL